MFNQDVLYAGFADIIAQINNLISDLLVAPAGIILLEPDDEIYYFLWNLWSTGIPSALGSIIFLSNEFPIPSHNCIWRKQHSTLLQHLSAEAFSLGCYPHSLAVAQKNPFISLFLMLQKDSHLLS